MRRIEEGARAFLALSEVQRSAHSAQRACAQRLPPGHYINRFNQGIRERLLPPEGGGPQYERGLYSVVVRCPVWTCPLQLTRGLQGLLWCRWLQGVICCGQRPLP